MTERRHIDTSDATRLWRHIFGDSRGHLYIWTGETDEAGRTKRAGSAWCYFSYPDDIESAATWALEKSKQDREVWFCVHLLTAPQRIEANAAEIRSLWADLDGVQIPDGNLRPSAVVETSPGHYQSESSPGHYHCYWRLTDAIQPEVAEELNRRLTDKIGADRAGCRLTRFFRVPGTRSYKHYEYPGHPPTAKVVRITDNIAYSPSQLDALVS